MAVAFANPFFFGVVAVSLYALHSKDVALCYTDIGYLGAEVHDEIAHMEEGLWFCDGKTLHISQIAMLDMQEKS